MNALTTHATEAPQGREDDLAMLRASALAFVTGTVDHKRGRALRNQLPGYDTAIHQQIAALGWHGILLPERFGGLGLGFAEMAVVLEELGKGLMGEPLAASVVLAGRALLHGDNEALKGQLLPALAQGKSLPCLAWQEEFGGIDAAAVTTRAQDTQSGVRITGRKRFLAGAGAASGFMVSARSAQGVGLYWVEPDAPGLAISHEWRADGTPATVLTLADVDVPLHRRAASPHTAVQAIERAVDEAAVMAAAEMLGVIRATLAITLDYMRTRVQFNKPIGSFQALQHRVVDLYIQQELTGAVVREATAVLDREPAQATRRAIASRAKARASDAGLRITREAIQLHGAIAIQDECNVGLYVKRALVLAAWLGNAGEHRRRFTREHIAKEQHQQQDQAAP